MRTLDNHKPLFFQAWLRFRSLPLRVTILAPPKASAAPPARELPPAEQAIEFDEAGRRYVFRFPPRQPATYTLDRERIFAYTRRRRRVMGGTFIDGKFFWKTQPLLPDFATRAYVRAAKNVVNYFEDVRDLQTHPEVIPLE
jgi:hypothetical protein